MAIVTLTRLACEGRLTLGDILSHSETGPHEFIGATDDGALIVVDSKGARHYWRIDFGPDARIVPVTKGA